jgi:hypothetical protein
MGMLFPAAAVDARSLETQNQVFGEGKKARGKGSETTGRRVNQFESGTLKRHFFKFGCLATRRLAGCLLAVSTHSIRPSGRQPTRTTILQSFGAINDINVS